MELGKGLEMGQYQISKYIPEYLGRAALSLHPSELDEQVLWLKNLLGSPTNIAVSGALNTVGVLLQHYPAYRGRFPEPERAYEARRQELLGLLLQGLAHYREEVRQEALLVTGTMLFDSPVLSMEEKSRLFSLCYRKLLFLIQAGPPSGPADLLLPGFRPGPHQPLHRPAAVGQGALRLLPAPEDRLFPRHL